MWHGADGVLVDAREVRVPRDAEELDADVVERARGERGEEVAVEHEGRGVGQLPQRQARRLPKRVVALHGRMAIQSNGTIEAVWFVYKV